MLSCRPAEGGRESPADATGGRGEGRRREERSSRLGVLGSDDCTVGFARGDTVATESDAKGVVLPDVGLESPMIPIAGEAAVARLASTSPAWLDLSFPTLPLPFLTALPPGVTGAGDSARPLRFGSSLTGPEVASSGMGVRESRSKGDTKSNMVLVGTGESTGGVEVLSPSESLTAGADSPLSDAAISSRDGRAVVVGGESGWGEGESILVGDINLPSNAAEALEGVVAVGIGDATEDDPAC